MQVDARTAHAAYQQGQINLAGPLQIVILLYEGAIRFSQQALNKFDDPALRGYALGRAHRIVSELLASLNYDKGMEIATNLDGLYRFILDSLTQANVNSDRRTLQSSLHLLQTLVPAWREIDSKDERVRTSDHA